MTLNRSDIDAGLPQEEAAGLAVLPSALRAVVQATPAGYCAHLLRLLDEYANRPAQDPLQAGIQFGELLGFIQAGCRLQVLTSGQRSDLVDFLTEVNL